MGVAEHIGEPGDRPECVTVVATELQRRPGLRDLVVDIEVVASLLADQRAIQRLECRRDLIEIGAYLGATAVPERLGHDVLAAGMVAGMSHAVAAVIRDNRTFALSI